MKKFYTTLITIAALLAFTACGDNITFGDTDNTDNTDNSDNSYTVTVDGNSTYTNDGSGVNDPYFGDMPYDENATQSECTAAGYFYCTVTDTCLNQPLTGGSCS